MRRLFFLNQNPNNQNQKQFNKLFFILNSFSPLAGLTAVTLILSMDVKDVTKTESKTTMIKCPKCGKEHTVQTLIPTDEMKAVGKENLFLFRVGYDIHLHCNCGADWNQTIYHKIDQGMKSFMMDVKKIGN